MTTSETVNILFSIFSQIEGATIKNVKIHNFGPDLTTTAFGASQLESAIFASEAYGTNNLIENITITDSSVLGNTTDGAGGLVTTVKANASMTIRNIKAFFRGMIFKTKCKEGAENSGNSNSPI